MQWSSHLELAGFCRPACPPGSWTCSRFAPVPVAVEFFPGQPCLPFCLLPARVARKPAKACLLLAQDKAWASFPGPRITKHHKNTGAEPKALVTFISALTDPVPQAPGLPAHSVASCHIEASGGGRMCLVCCWPDPPAIPVPLLPAWSPGTACLSPAFPACLTPFQDKGSHGVMAGSHHSVLSGKNCTSS